jgi:DNA-binding NtrC family response regulator
MTRPAESPAVRSLVVDDKRAHRDAMVLTLQKLGHETREAHNVETALRLLQESSFDVVITDMELPRADGEAASLDCGLEVIRQARSLDPDAAILAITGYATVENAVQAMQAGAVDYINKGSSLQEIRVRLGRALEGRHLRRENRRLASENQLLRNQVQMRYGPSQIVGQSPKMRALFDRIVLCANTNLTVLVRGESGTGKELVARAIHYSSPRRERPMFTINCTSLSHALIESELFGHRHGSFTGASEDRKGLFEEANGSTLFLDEIGDMPLETQPKLLRAIELKEFKRIGENTAHTSDVRIVAATNQNLLGLVEEGRFREDLYARLEVVTLVLPPLRERLEDIPLLVEHFLHKLFEEGHPGCPRITEDALRKLQAYSWPRNVRELESVLTQACLFSQDGVLDADHIQLTPTAPGRAVGEWLDAYAHGLSLREAREKLERDLVRRALRDARGNMTRAAEALGMQRPNLYRKLRELGIEPEANT